MTDQNTFPSNKPLWVVIVNWNKAQLTEACINSFENQVKEFDFTMLIIDNGSKDHSVDYLRTRFPGINMISLPENLGFAGGYNHGLHTAYHAGAKHVLIVNNDTVADDELLKNLINGSKETQADLCAPVIYYLGTKEKIWSAGGKINTLLKAPLVSHNRNKKLPAKPTKRDFISGCTMLINRKVIDTIGYFDEDFFLYYEDLDYCYRAKRAGLQTYLIPSAKMWHHVSASSQGTNSPEERYWMGYSSQRYFRKHVSGFGWLAVAPWQFIHVIKTWISLVFNGDSKAARSFIKGVLDGVKSDQVQFLDVKKHNNTS